MMEIKYKILFSTIELKGYNVEITTKLILKCISKWNRVFNKIICITPGNGIDTEIDIMFGVVDKSKKEDEEEGERVGECRNIKSIDGTVKTIIILDKDSNWDIGSNKFITNLKRLLGIGKPFENVLMHELGHSLGLPHQPKEYKYVMSKNCPSNEIGFTEGIEYVNYFNNYVRRKR